MYLGGSPFDMISVHIFCMNDQGVFFSASRRTISRPYLEQQHSGIYTMTGKRSWTYGYKSEPFGDAVYVTADN